MLNRLFRTLFVSSVVWILTCCPSCNQSKENELDINNDFKVVNLPPKARFKVPKFLSSTTGLTTGKALAEFSHLDSEMYVAVFQKGFKQLASAAESTKLNVDQSMPEIYAEMLLKKDEQSFTLIESDLLSDGTINGLKSLVTESIMLDKHSGQKISYIDGYFQGTMTVTVIRCWTVNERIDEHRNTFNQIIQSVEGEL